MHHSTSIFLFPIYQHQRLLTVVYITRIATRTYHIYGVVFQKLFTQHFIACRRIINGFQKYLYISKPNKFASAHLAHLSQDSDVILTVRFKYASIIEDLGF